MKAISEFMVYAVHLPNEERAEMERVLRIKDAHARLIEIAKRPELWFRV